MVAIHAVIIGFAVASGMFAGACAGTASTPGPQLRQVLAPSGKLRVGLYAGSPTSIVGDPMSGQARGVGFDLGRELARRVGVPVALVVFAKNADVLSAVKSGDVDVTFTNATAARAKDMDFSPPFLEVEKGFLVPATSAIATDAELDRPGIRIGVSQGSSTESELAGKFTQAVMVPTPSVSNATQMLATGKLDAFATNKAILFEMSDDLPGSRVLDGHWGLERFAVAIPKGREQAAAYLRQFVADVTSSGVVSRAVLRAGLRGVVPAESRGNRRSPLRRLTDTQRHAVRV